MNVQLNVKGVIGALIFALLFAVALQTRPVSDYVVRVFILTLVIGGSVLVVVRMIRRGDFTPPCKPRCCLAA